MQTFAFLFFFNLHNTVHISINYFIFKHSSEKKWYIDCRRKINSIKLERFETLIKNLHLFIPFFWFDDTFNQLSVKFTSQETSSYLIGTYETKWIQSRSLKELDTMHCLHQEVSDLIGWLQIKFSLIQRRHHIACIIICKIQVFVK